jgi:hypothetical protein
MSNVWKGEWRDMRVGSCQERALTLHALYEDLGISSQYHEGWLELENNERGKHAWTTVQDEYISDPSVSGGGLFHIEDEEADRYQEWEICVM